MTKKTKSGIRRDGRQSSQSQGDHKKAQKRAEMQRMMLERKRDMKTAKP